MSNFEQIRFSALVTVVTSPNHPWRFSVTERPVVLPPAFSRGRTMEDINAKLEKFLSDADDCDLIAKLAVDQGKRDSFRHLAKRLRQMADDLRAVIESGTKQDVA